MHGKTDNPAAAGERTLSPGERALKAIRDSQRGAPADSNPQKSNVSSRDDESFGSWSLREDAVRPDIGAALESNVVVTQAAADAEWARGKVEEVTAAAAEHDALAGPLQDDPLAGPLTDEDLADEPVDAQALTRQEPGADGSALESVGQPARDIAKAIASRLAEAIGIDPSDERLGINLAMIDGMVNGSFWSGSKSKVFLLNEFQNLNQFLGGDAYKFLVRAFGEPVDAKAIAEMTEQFIADRDLTKPQAKALRDLTAGAAGTVIVDHLKYCNQRESVEWRCDMFADDARMRLLEDKARIVLAHKPFEVRGRYEPEIVDDYKQHFTRFDEFLQFLVQSRFALDRKKCYLWILADSDWGKGFLLGVLGEMGLAVSTSMTEIEAMFDGRPVGRAPEEFKRAFALVVDEFKTVKSELKQLQSKITLSPKNQLTSEVEVFAKLFLSAESVASLVTSHGVEDQFANRMSVFQEIGTLVQRPLYLEVGNPRYFASVLNYAADTMNRMVAEMQSLGLEGAQTGAERWINGFISRYGLDTLHDRFSDSLPDVAADVLSWLYAQPHLLSQEGSGEHSKYYLPSANKVLDTYLNEHFDVSEVQTYRRRKPEILRLLSTDGKGLITRKPNGKHTKCVALMRPGCSGEDLAARRDASPADDSEEF
ncbi:hypothetical protein [Paraburkholderia sp. Cpub6]|uniref:hypothetical protein n=1 Tax=Paraburkholderia sp. Cpub6 TaxID=2723094 RepID=UPI001621D4A0|nr:hypothetical protein [Paraburkholderia sp. Cpub6]MBB5463790.1 hypothetical protein [Paraburkholderia sp. Cpub6]